MGNVWIRPWANFAQYMDRTFGDPRPISLAVRAERIKRLGIGPIGVLKQTSSVKTNKASWHWPNNEATYFDVIIIWGIFRYFVTTPRKNMQRAW